MIKFIKNKNKLSAQRGYAILELLFYIAFFAVLSLVVINSLIVMTGSFKDNIAQAELIQSGGIMERISRGQASLRHRLDKCYGFKAKLKG